jgi:uncharacterized protein YneF (UPF0154 family)
MSEPLFSIIDVIFFFISGMALGFVLGAMLMKKTMKAFAPPDPEPLRVLQELAGFTPPDDGGESFHEECGDR